MKSPQLARSASEGCSLIPRLRFGLVLLIATFVFTTPLAAHPVPRSAHDRVIVVRLTPDALIVDYHLEIDEWTVVFKDLPAVLETDELAKLKRDDFYPTFVKSYGPVLAK